MKQFVDLELEIKILEKVYAKKETESINRNLFLGDW